jgi:hypothetical protein
MLSDIYQVNHDFETLNSTAAFIQNPQTLTHAACTVTSIAKRMVVVEEDIGALLTCRRRRANVFAG